jgi:hypothetical protein
LRRPGGASQAGGTRELIEHKRWVTGCLLWTEAKQVDDQMPILFSPGQEHAGIMYRAIIDGVVADEDQTTCRYFELHGIAPAWKLSEVQLKAG